MLRVAIVGLGPKGMFALERLLDHASGLNAGARIEVDAFEPHQAPGAGPVYDPAQPSYLRMNFAADAVDMWWPTSSTVPPDERRSFVMWSDSLPAGGDRERYPPRALVGRYLADGLQVMLRHAPPSTRIRVRPTRVLALARRRGGWAVVGAAGSAGLYDEVLIATGHERSWAGALATDWAHAAGLVPSVFPVERWLSPQRVDVGATVAVRGFALSFIDAALALTEGRGGRFEPVDDSYRLRYSPGDADVGLILPFSRSGRPMLAKPDPGLAAGVPALDVIAEEGRERILRLADGVDLRQLLVILTAAARANLLAAGDRATGAVALDVALGAWLTAAASGLPVLADCGPAQEIEQSLAVSAGRRAPGLQWALGHTWRSLYPALVRRLGDDRLAARHWPAFRRLAAAMERVAFGPPASNAAKLLALIDAGRIDLTHVRGGHLTSEGARTWLRGEHGEHAVDVVIDAVLPGPGTRGAHSELLRRLVNDGHARVLAGRRGLDVGPDGGCRGANGTPTAGLAAIGRPTEDAVIGNDTLSRTLHPLGDQWARRVVRRSRDDARRSGLAAQHEDVA